MASVFLLLVFCTQTVFGSVSVFPKQKPEYCESFIPPAAQIVYHVIEQTKYGFNAPKIYASSVDVNVRRPLEESNESILEEGRTRKKELTPTQKQLLNLHTHLIREAKLQGLARHQGYSENVLQVLRETSKMTAVDQLKTVLQLALLKMDIQRADTKEAAENVLEDLYDTETDLYKLMSGFETLQYS